MLRVYIVGTMLMGSSAAMAQPFDKPVSSQTVTPKSESDPLGELRCTFFPDLMIRETGTDTPAPGRATLITNATACDRASNPVDKVLVTAGYRFAGRKGTYMVFSAVDPNGAIPFKVLDTSGKVLYSDSLTGDFKTIEIETGLHLRFTRAVNAPCSVLIDTTCWAKLGSLRLLPQAVVAQKPPIEACAASYKSDKAGADNPSVITYDADMTIDASGKPQVKSRGPVGCQPMP